MKVLELYSGDKWGCFMLTDFGFEVTSIRIEIFDYSIFPRGSFDIVFININNHHLDENDDVNYMDMAFGLDIITYYDKYYWIINNNNKNIRDDIITWGLPYKDINIMRGGKLMKTRIYNSMYKWRPNDDRVYIQNKFILLELLQNT